MKAVKKIYYIFITVIILTVCFVISVNAQKVAKLSKDLPKTKDTVPVSKTDTTEEDEENDITDEKVEKIDPARNYKLVAIYLIGKNPRALIKNTTTPEEPPKEYQLGDWIDETFVISKISFNPTIRIELADEEGLSYLLKPQDVTAGNQSSSQGKTKSLPSYFSSGSKYKIKKYSQATTESTSTPTPTTSPTSPTPSTPSPTPPGESTTSTTSQATTQTTETTPTNSQTTSGGSLQGVSTGSSSNTMAPSSSGASSSGSTDSSRPVDPFAK